MTKLEKLLDKIRGLPPEKLSKFFMAYYGEQHIISNIQIEIDSIVKKEGEKVAIEYLESALKGI